MVQADRIKDKDSLKSWLEARPEETRQRDAVKIAHRSAMRALPIFIHSLAGTRTQESPITALPILRANLTSGTYAENPAPEVKKAAYSAATASYSASSPSTAGTTADASTAADAAAVATAHAAMAAGAATARSPTWNRMKDDIAALERDRSPERSALWSDYPELFQRSWAAARDWLGANPGHDFWVRWYEAALEGRPLTGDWDSHWQLLTDIALLPDDDWAKGAEQIAKLIAEIEERHRLLAETQRLKTALSPIIASTAPAPIGHNHPPEPLEEVPLPRQLTLIWDTLDQAERELSKPKPEKSVLLKIGQRLKDAGIAIASYCGHKADKALDKAVEALGTAAGKWTAAIIAAKFAGLDDALTALGAAIKAFAGG